MTAAARKPRFAADPQRRLLIAKVHVAKKELALADDDYRAVIFDITGKTSAGDCDTDQLVKIVKAFQAKGFQAKRASRPAAADHPSARKARALWISLYQLGAIRDPSDRALEAFAARQLGCDRLQWADQAQCYKLVEALKAIAERNGWKQSLAGVPPVNQTRVLLERLCEAILARLVKAGLAPAAWSLTQAAWSLLGNAREPAYRPWEIGELEAIAAGLAAKLRQHG